MTLTYKQQLADPRWQRRRLQILELAGWECNGCGAAEKTFHVHHPRYIKGRMAWEYGDDQLEALCVDCHSRHHEMDKAVEEASHEFALGFRTIAGVSAGFLDAGLDLQVDPLPEFCPESVFAGVLARMLHGSSRDLQKKVALVFAESGEQRNPSELRALAYYGAIEYAQ